MNPVLRQLRARQNRAWIRRAELLARDATSQSPTGIVVVAPADLRAISSVAEATPDRGVVVFPRSN